MENSDDRPGLIAAAWRLLTFRLSREEFLALDDRHLAFGLVATWIAGMGRYWDNPKAEFLQHLGVGSLVYAVVLAAFLYGLTVPLGPKNWTYKRVLTFVSLTSPPAILYAIPVERFMEMSAAQNVNVAFLAVVASWRVALLVFFLLRCARLSVVKTFVATLLPLTLIIVALTVLNLEHATFEIMGGLNPEDTTPYDASYAIVWGLAFLSPLVLPFLLALYGGLAIRERSRRGPDDAVEELEDAA